ncbi:copper-binding protein [Hydrogenophaga sp.]|uniref:copper-binding protein n=1 Tax=Hydrogenophaga sp. TaxID=1904254 RepID=UPI00286DC9E1|nr:copper-binding protein [Hydrogenophaga sp.]
MPFLSRNTALCGAMLALLVLAAPATAQTTAGHDHAHTPAAPSAPAAAELPWTDAHVRRIDTAAGKVSLQHGDIKNLDMPPMTMVFQVRDPASLTGLAVGDPVRFTAEKLLGVYTVLQIEKRP